MLIDFILLFLFAGVPYYVFFEKTKIIGKEKIFLLSSLLVICGMILSYQFPQRDINAVYYRSIYSFVIFSYIKQTKQITFIN